MTGVQTCALPIFAGFANLDIAKEMVPALTTVQVEATAMGTCAADLIVKRLSGVPLPSNRIDLGFSIVVRDSA